MPNLVLFTEDGPKIGLGHAMRCLAMAQACKAGGGKVVFAVEPEMANVRNHYGMLGRVLKHRRSDIMQNINNVISYLSVNALGPENTWLLVDGYNYSDADIGVLQQTGYRVARFSDGANGNADLVVNQHLYGSALDYTCQTLCGIAYAPIRSDFIRYGKPRRNYFTHPKRILVSLGGYANIKIVREVVYYLSRTNGYEIVVTGINKHDPTLQVGKVRIYGYLYDMPQIMAWADIGIVTASVTCYEALYAGLPLLVASVTPNQNGVLESLLHVGACSKYTDENSIAEFVSNGVLRNSVGTLGAQLIDGYGCKRILEWMGAHQ